MPANTAPIYTLTPNIGKTTITQTSANTSSAGGGTVGTDIFKAFTAGANGSFLRKVRFLSVATAPTSSVATTLRVFISTVGSGATTAADTFLLAEISVGVIASDAATAATNFYEYTHNDIVPAGSFIHVAQHVAQTANQNWIAVAFGGDY
jgi:hypothetical protein